MPALTRMSSLPPRRYPPPPPPLTILFDGVSTLSGPQIGLKQGKTVITVKDVPGFYVNRCLGPFLAEVMALTLQVGIPLDRLPRTRTRSGRAPLKLCSQQA